LINDRFWPKAPSILSRQSIQHSQSARDRFYPTDLDQNIVTKGMSDFLNSVFWADILLMIELSADFDKTCFFRPLFNNDMI
jgi:hypothetical protein